MALWLEAITSKLLEDNICSSTLLSAYRRSGNKSLQQCNSIIYIVIHWGKDTEKQKQGKGKLQKNMNYE